MRTKNNNQSIIRGACIFFIMLANISAFTKPNCIFRAFTSYGYLWGGIFFFFAGGNLYNSYQNNPDFFRSFWKKKIIRIYLPLVLSNILYIFIKIQLYNVYYNNTEILKNIFGITCINDNNWFIYAVLLFYLSSWIILKFLSFIKKYKYNKLFLFITAILIFLLYSILYYNVAMNLHLTSSIRNVYPLTLLFGMIYSFSKTKILKVLKNKFVSEIAIISLFFASATLHYANINQYNFFVFNVEQIDYLVPIFFTLLIMIISTKVKLKSKLCMFMDSISLETYIFHYVILCLFSNPTFQFKSNYIFLLFYLVTVILISYMVHNFTNRLTFIGNKIKN